MWGQIRGQVLRRKLRNCHKLVFWWETPGKGFKNTFTVLSHLQSQRTGNDKLHQKDFGNTVLIEFPLCFVWSMGTWLRERRPELDWPVEWHLGSVDIPSSIQCPQPIPGGLMRTRPCRFVFPIKILDFLAPEEKTAGRRCYRARETTRVAAEEVCITCLIPANLNVVFQLPACPYTLFSTDSLVSHIWLVLHVCHLKEWRGIP